MTEADRLAADPAAHPWFFCGIGGSGMLPLALILKARGAEIAGSDRSRDAGRTPEKFAFLGRQGIALFPQDGSGITDPAQVLIASAAIEDSVPEVAAAKALGATRLSRAQCLSALFNAAPHPIAIAGTSGKSTVTGMIGWILTMAGRDPVIVNGAVMKNFVDPATPFASARVGQGADFVAEVDESDGSIVLYRPAVGVLGNVSLDHKSLEELRELFGDFCARCGAVALNADDAESMALGHRARGLLTFGMGADATIAADPASIFEGPTTITACVIDRRSGATHDLALAVPGRHNLMNALAALAAASLSGVPLADAVAALGSFAGLSRRFDIVGTSASGVTLIDDFGHNPEKVAATLATLRTHPGRVIALFQPHGYGPLRQMGMELAQVLATRLTPEDRVILTDPVYFGGTVDRSVGSEAIVAAINAAGGHAQHIPTRDNAAAAIIAMARPGDRVVVMGARDDTLATFASDLLAAL